MKVIIAEYAGFCFGVERALKKAESALQTVSPKNVYTLGPLIHNPQVIKRLEQRGASIIDDIEEISSGTLIIRSHGVDPKIIQKAQSRGLKVVDATCPYVKRVQKQAKSLLNEGFQVVIVGEKNHPEVQGILGAIDGQGVVALSPNDLLGLSFDKVGVVAQTTQSEETFKACVDYLADTSREIRVYSTICQATEQRQKAAIELAKKVDVMIIIGGKQSGNTRRLHQLCLEVIPRAYHIERPDELEAAWFKPTDLVGVTAGASTPDWVIEGVVERMSEMEKQDLQVDVPANEEAAKEEAASTEENQEAMMQSLEQSELKRGEVLTAKVVSID
ncbi:MAG TPA: 4-hydroxy-3-methylbut-2-enyl diphosphate reductase, partial [Firmicutes bacterium]|nr:4-hydroxy-3-methylbut-2-enyl diphosphate reductase [Bacillota bacterium]